MSSLAVEQYLLYERNNGKFLIEITKENDNFEIIFIRQRAVSFV